MQRANDRNLVIGLSSGTSMDGIDAAVVGIDGDAGGALELVAFRTFPYDDEVRQALRRLTEDGRPSQLALLGVIVGEAFARAALDILQAASLQPDDVLGIGSHGQTIAHVPEPAACAGTFARASLQIGEPAVIAERTGITTVADFRARDLAAGGQGAPLAPLLDHRLYAHPDRGRVALNIGGIANITGLPPGCELSGVTAFDTGPGNVLLDAAARMRGLADGFDRDGRIAVGGAVRDALLDKFLAHPFYIRKPPKSADTTDFLNDAARALLRGAEPLSDADLLATLTDLTARTVNEGIVRFIAVRQPVDEILVSGGGLHNRALRARLEALLAPAKLRDADEVVPTVPGDAKEAVLFALLANETLAQRPGNVPAATGAAGPRVLGVVVRAV
jgi:anhydro-N-acetylmuramic acid kinase